MPFAISIDGSFLYVFLSKIMFYEILEMKLLWNCHLWNVIFSRFLKIKLIKTKISSPLKMLLHCISEPHITGTLL